ncbi:MAG: TonB-dependent hemoglobin/transferrin/lactoferrin family receptor [Moraxellaceae bacterium]|nr:TonB-dependent hemoglobin/transferrin/lactoferrin family receptor [Moraxellaceae bacterium]
MLHRPPYPLTLLAASLLMASTVHANERQTSQFDVITVTATKQAQTLDEVPATVSVQTEQDIDRGNINRIVDLTRYEPGVSVSGTGSRFGQTGFTIRGIGGNRVLTQVDGVSVANAFSFGPFQSSQRNYIDVDTLKQVEIIRGPASSLYGSDAIGGAVSFITKDAADYLKDGQNSALRLKTGYDSRDHGWQRSATVAARQGQFDMMLHAGQRTADEVRSHGGRGGIGAQREQANPADAESQNILAKLGWNTADGGRLQLTLDAFDDKVKSRLLNEYSDTAAIRTSDSDDKTQRRRISLQHQLPLNVGWADQLSWQINHQRSETDQQLTQQRVVAGQERLRQRDSVYEEDLWTITGHFDKAFEWGRSEHQLTYGLDLKRLENKNLRNGSEVVNATGAPVPPAPGTETFPLSDFPDPNTVSVAAFIQDQINYGRWSFLPGLRYDHYRLKPQVTEHYLNANRAEPNPPQYSDSALSPKLGIVYALTANTDLYGQYAAGFRAPQAIDIFGEFSNPAHGYQNIPNYELKAETSHSLELGVRNKSRFGSLAAALFSNRYNDFIEQVAIAPTGPGQLLTFQQQNLDRVDIHGAELKAEVFLDELDLPQGMYARTSVAYARGQDKGLKQPLNSVDPLKGIIGLGYKANDEKHGAEFIVTVVEGKRRIDATEASRLRLANGQFKSPGFVTADVQGWWQATPQLTVNAGLYNLNDKQHWSWGDVRGRDSEDAGIGRFSQPGRTAAINVVYQF